MRVSFVLVALIVASVTSEIPNAQAQLKVLEGNEISIGKIYQTGQNIHRMITVVNSGNEKITINHVSTSCGCTAAVISDSSLDPGQQAQIKIEFNPVGYIGDVTKYIYISNSSPKSQLITVKMTGYVAYALQPTPNYAMFAATKVGSADSSTISLSNTSTDTILITNVEVPDSEITYRLEKKVLSPGEYTDLHLYLDLKEVKEISGFITILSSSNLQPVLKVRVFSQVFR